MLELLGRDGSPSFAVGGAVRAGPMRPAPLALADIGSAGGGVALGVPTLITMVGACTGVVLVLSSAFTGMGFVGTVIGVVFMLDPLSWVSPTAQSVRRHAPPR